MATRMSSLRTTISIFGMGLHGKMRARLRLELPGQRVRPALLVQPALLVPPVLLVRKDLSAPLAPPARKVFRV